MLTQDLSFDEWFDIFVGCTARLGYTGMIDKYTFEADYENSLTPEEAAESFVKEMNS